eukprot:TRINITY_DN7520_c0_g1_i8.p3 TRINITY_DN7520_c0_g1~~TRINITY_DN7520_c0_g1_i8.p3  ORF type:complete len:127 (-),score=2.42 TRINITY_DN7520_c0_g1_i8:402-782(-)
MLGAKTGDSQLYVSQVGGEQLGSVVQLTEDSAKIHLCVQCQSPINTYGRLHPCLHAYCLTCAAEMSICYICSGDIHRMERISSQQGLYISSLTLQSHKTQDHLAQHTKKVLERLQQQGLITLSRFR